MFRKSLPILLAAAMIALAPASAQREAAGRYKDWAVYTETIGGDYVCFAATPASDVAPKDFEHGEVHLFVGFWKSGKAKRQPSLRVGYNLRPELAPTIRIGRQTWTLYSAKDREMFAYDEDDGAIVRALERGSEARVEAVSASGTAVTYHFSLSGSSSAIDKASELCR